MWAQLRYQRHSNYRPSGAARLPNGDLLILERRFTLLEGVGIRLVRVSESEKRALAPDAATDGQEELQQLQAEIEEARAARDEAEDLSVTFNDAAEFAEGADRAGEDDDDRSPSWKTRAEETRRGHRPRRGKGYGYRRVNNKQ